MLGNQTPRRQRNLPTLIEASPDFSQKKLPYLPNLPPSVQMPSSENIYNLARPAESIPATDDLPSLYSVPVNKLWGNQKQIKKQSSYEEEYTSTDRQTEGRKTRSGSITFDLDRELVRRNSSKKRGDKSRDRDKEKSKTKSKPSRNKSPEPSPDQKHSRRARKDKMPRELENVDTKASEVMSMWSCCKCTLENELQETTCQACGGSRLSSIGDIQVPDLVVQNPMGQNIMNLLADEGLPLEQREDANGKWRCIICTLENEPMAFYCDACNSENPKKADIVAKQTTGNPVVTNEDNEEATTGAPPLTAQFARYFGIFCFLSIICYSLVKMLVCAYASFSSVFTIIQEVIPYSLINDFWNNLNEIKTDTDLINDDNTGEIPDNCIVLDIISYNCFGLNPTILSLFCPLFIYILICMRHDQNKEAPRVPMPM